MNTHDIKPIWLEPLQAVMKYISQECTQNLKNVIVSLQFKNMSLMLYFYFTDDEIIVDTTCSEEPDVIIKGSVFDFLSVLMAQDDHKQWPQDMEIIGSIAVAQSFQDVFKHIDIEEYISRILGDEATYYVSDLYKSSTNMARYVEQNILSDISEYLYFETQTLVDKTELELFFQEVSKVRNDIERLQQKINQIKT